MKVSLLGPLEVIGRDGRPVVVGPLKRRVVLGLLALEQGRPVSTARLIDALWGEDPPSSALATLQGLVYQLRQLLGSEVIESRAPGYRLAIELAETDLGAFTELADAGSADALSEALGLFRGSPLDDLGDGDVVVAARQRLVDGRISVFERWCDLELEAGTAAPAVVSRIQAELEEAPFRESLWERLMLALYRSNRQADALQAYAARALPAGRGAWLGAGSWVADVGAADLASRSEAQHNGGGSGRRSVGRPTGGHGDVPVDGRCRVVGFVERAPGSMDAALARHEEILDIAVTEHGGVLLKARGEGDSTFSGVRRAITGVGRCCGCADNSDRRSVACGRSIDGADGDTHRRGDRTQP